MHLEKIEVLIPVRLPSRGRADLLYLTASMTDSGRDKRALLTVGSTHFDELVKAALDPAALAALRDQGITSLVVQYGAGNIRQILRYVALDPEEGFPTVSGGVTCTIKTGEAVNVEMHPFLDDIDERMGLSDLVISHAGGLHMNSPVNRSLLVWKIDPTLLSINCIRCWIHLGSTPRTSSIDSQTTAEAAHHCAK